jgi:uncharacterized membrane protein YfcA
MTQSNDPEQQPRPLDYASQPKPRSPIGSAVAGAFLGVMSTVGAMLLAVWTQQAVHLPIFIGIPLALVCFLALLLAAQSAFSGRSQDDESRRKRRFYIVGFVIGCGIGGLLEGLCFSALSKI